MSAKSEHRERLALDLAELHRAWNVLEEEPVTLEDGIGALLDAARSRIAVSREADGAGDWDRVQPYLTDGTSRELAYREALCQAWGMRHVPTPTTGPVHPVPTRGYGGTITMTGPAIPCQRCAGTGVADLPTGRRCPECYGTGRVPA